MATHRQQWGKSCGASSLMVAANELGVNALPNYGGGGAPNPNFAGWAGQAIGPGNFGAAEWEVWRATSDGNFADSMPAEMGIAARALGLNPTVHLVGLVFPWAVKCLYPRAEQDCINAGIPVKYNRVIPLLWGQRQLCVVNIAGTTLLHWVLMRPSWTYMDPADGVDRYFWISMGQGPVRIQKYIYTGISLVVE